MSTRSVFFDFERMSEGVRFLTGNYSGRPTLYYSSIVLFLSTELVTLASIFVSAPADKTPLEILPLKTANKFLARS